MQNNLIIRIILLMLPLWTMTAQADVIWYDGSNAVAYNVMDKVEPVVEVALQMFSSDMEAVTGQQAHKVQQATKGTICIYELDKAGSSAIKKLKKAGIPTNEIEGRKDAFCIAPIGEQIYVVGSNGRGCAYGILEMSRMAGVSPWIWWGDVVPEKKKRLSMAEDFCTVQAPSVEYRGIFINDEDWSLRNWAWKNFDKSDTEGRIGPKTYKAIFQLLLRLRANVIWPAMHEGTTGFFTVEGNKAVADSCGILIGTSHCEPLLRNNVAEWDKAKRGAYNYITNGEQVREYWAERLREVKGSEEFFTIGMRGIHDGSMEGVKTPEEKLKGLQKVIDDQRMLIKKYYNKNVTKVPQVFIPYKEVLEIMESGLRVPGDVTLMWCDDNYGYMTRLSDSEQQKRQGGGGVYYHLSYWGRPHDYLWLTTTQPGLIYSEMKAAYDHNCRKLWIVNVHDPKAAAYDLEFFLDMAWNIDAITPQTIYNHMEQWLCTQYGEKVGKRLAPAMKEYYRLCSIRKPEFMGWTQVELDKKKVPGGKSRIGKIEMTREEAAMRLEAFGRIKATIDGCRLLVRPELQNAYFANIEYPVYAAAAMTRKIVSDKDASHQAWMEIQQLTERYNALNNGKWNGLMSAAPRGLPVYADENAQLAEGAPLVGVARNACEYQRAEGKVQPIQMLGHSMNAVAIEKGGELTFSFETSQGGEAALYTAMIPTQPNDKGDLRYQVAIDNQKPIVISLKEKYRSEFWKKSVLRGQALKKIFIRIGSGKHTLKVKALDEHIIMDQWMIDFDTERKFYNLVPSSRLQVPSKV